MKRVLVLVVRTFGWALFLLVLACLLMAVVCEVHGIPDWAANAVRAAAADRGISLRADRFRAGLVRGVVLEQVRVRLDRWGSLCVVTCQEVRLRPCLAALVQGEFLVQDATFRGAALTLEGGPVATGASTAASVRFERCNGLAQRLRDGTLALTIDGLAAKIAVHLEAEVAGLRAIPLGQRSGQAATRPARSASPTAAGQSTRTGPAVAEPIRRAAELLAAARLSERDAFLSGRLAVDLEQPGEFTFDGEVGFSDLVLSEVLVSRCKSGLHCRRSEFRLHSLRLVTGSGETVTGDMLVELDAERLSGTARGRLLPETLRRLLPESQGAWLSHVQSAVPLDFSLELLPSPWSPELWRATGELAGRDLRLPGLDIRRLSAVVAADGPDIVVDPWRVELDAGGMESAQGRLTWHRSDGTLEGDCVVRCSPLERIRQSGRSPLFSALRGIDFPVPVTLQARLERSPPDWRRLHAHATLAAEALRVHGRPVGPLSIAAALREGTLTFDPLHAGFADAPTDALAVRLTADLPRALASGAWEVGFEVCCKAETEAAPASTVAPLPWSEVAALRGTALYTSATGAVEIRAEGSGCPGRWYACYLPRLGLPASAIIRDIRAAGAAPARVSLKAGRSDQRQPFQAQLAVSAEGARYGDLVFRTIQGAIEVRPRQLVFQGVRATTAAGDELALDLQLDTDPVAVTIRNARVKGNPDVVKAFIDDQDAKAIYRAVWRDFHWGPEDPAVIDLRSLVYRATPDGRNWELTVDAGLQVQQAAYRDLPLKRLDATVVLRLPDAVTVRVPLIETDTATIEGSAEFITSGEPKCTFAMRQVAGGQDPTRILGLLNPAWASALGPLSFASDTAVDCRGSFSFERESSLQLSGSLRGTSAQFYGLPVEAPVGEWGLSRSEVRWNLTSGKLFGGPLAVTGLYDLEAGRGTLALRGESMALAQVAAYLGMKRDDGPQLGLLSAHCRLDILKGWTGRPLQVYGDGSLSLQQADLWQVPLFNTLSRVLDVTFLNRLTGGKVSNLGRITCLDADLGFAGDRAVVRSLATDGTIVSLRGHGQYCWETDAIHLVVSGQALDSAGIVGLIFRPLSWAFFNAELTGTAKDNRWRLLTALSKALPGGADAVEAPLPPASP